MQKEVKNVDEMHALAGEFVNTLKKSNTATVVLLQGDLGSGKTTFTQGVAEALGVRETITSPTFVILKNYELQHDTFHTLVHIDAYRLKDAEELSVLNWEQIAQDSGNLVLIEWPQLFADTLAGSIYQIHFTFVDENTRNVTIE